LFKQASTPRTESGTSFSSQCTSKSKEEGYLLLPAFLPSYRIVLAVIILIIDFLAPCHKNY